MYSDILKCCGVRYFEIIFFDSFSYFYHVLLLYNMYSFRTFAPVWDVLKLSTEKLASSHLDLVRKLQELIKEVQKYGDEQTKAHKKVRRYLVK